MLYQITEFRYITFFFIYSFLGWIFESVYVSIKSGRWINRGFLKGPVLPIYGSGAVMMLVVSEPFSDNLILTYLAGVVGATLLELISGMAIEAIFKVRYWDYSYQKINYKGYICLSSSIAWGFFTIGMTRWLHPAVILLVSMVPHEAGDILFAAVAILFDVDLVVSVREATDLRNLLIHMESVRHEMQLLKKRADVIMAVMDDDLKEMKTHSAAAFHLGDLRSALEFQFEHMKERIPLLKEIPEEQMEEFEELQARFALIKNNIHGIIVRNSENMRKRLRANPTMVSKKYSISLDILRHRLKEEEKRISDRL